MNTAPLLVLTDFTPVADQTLQYAGFLAGQLETSVVLLHVRRTSLLDALALTGKYPRRSEAEVRALLAERCAGVQAGGTACRSEVVEGDVATAFAAAARQVGALLAVAGKCNTEETPDELVDSTTLGLLTRTPCPLLIVPEAYRRWAVPARVVIAADRDPVELAGSGTATNALLRRWQPALTVARVELLGSSEWPDATATAEMLSHTPLLTGITDIKPLHYGSLDVLGGILSAAHDKRADWVLLVARRRSRLGRLFHRSVTAEVVLHSQVPVLVVAEA